MNVLKLVHIRPLMISAKHVILQSHIKRNRKLKTEIHVTNNKIIMILVKYTSQDVLWIPFNKFNSYR